jgi:hypothetical protein
LETKKPTGKSGDKNDKILECRHLITLMMKRKESMGSLGVDSTDQSENEDGDDVDDEDEEVVNEETKEDNDQIQLKMGFNLMMILHRLLSLLLKQPQKRKRKCRCSKIRY